MPQVSVVVCDVLTCCIAEFSLHENPSSDYILDLIQKGAGLYIYITTVCSNSVTHSVSISSS